MNTTLLSEPESVASVAPPILAFTVLGRPQQRGSKQAHVRCRRDGKPVTKNAKDDNAKFKGWMQEVRAAAHAAWGNRPLIVDPVELTTRFYFARPTLRYGQERDAAQGLGACGSCPKPGLGQADSLPGGRANGRGVAR